MSRRKPRTPYFTHAELLSDGTVKLLTDEGDQFHVEMRNDDGWPLVSRARRWRDQFDYGARVKEPELKPPLSPPFKPRLIS
jgi:hypothetical protein